MAAAAKASTLHRLPDVAILTEEGAIMLLAQGNVDLKSAAF